MALKEIIEQGRVDALNDFLSENPGYANQKIRWGSFKEIETDPLHYVSDCVFNGLLTNGKEADIARVLLAHSANLEGSEKAESPLIGAVSLSAEKVATVLIEAGADINAISIYGANALHWAAYVGLPGIVSRLLDKGADIEKRCIAFQATPLFWAVQGFRKSKKADKSSIVAAAKVLVDAGADVNAKNIEQSSVLDRARATHNGALIRIIESGV